jgi:hypothetical protein
VNKYKCKFCNIFFIIFKQLKHIETKKHSSRKKLKYMELRFEKKMNETDIDIVLKQLEEYYVIY